VARKAGENSHARYRSKCMKRFVKAKTTCDLAKQETIKSALLLQEEVDVSLVSSVTDQGYASNLTDDEVVKIGRDPFLIAYALKKKIPDVL